ncbi:MAG: primosomal protein N' [Clostridia bacterium]|nr:primosomal protein N' [Clostridia bacterium]
MRKTALCAVAAANILFDKPYSYFMTPEVEQKAAVGMRVKVPFGHGNRKTEGVIIGFSTASADEPYKFVTSIEGEASAIHPDLLKLAMWLRKRCYCPLYDVLRSMVPSAVSVEEKPTIFVSLAVGKNEAKDKLEKDKRLGEKSRNAVEILMSGRKTQQDLLYLSGISLASLRTLEKKGYVILSSEDSYQPTQKREPTETALTPAQNEVYTSLRDMMGTGKASCALLHGITGSGKTHIYIKLISDTIRNGKAALLLVPEIALTPQLIQRFYAIFGERVACLHSALTDTDRRREWNRVRRGDADVVVGTRSAVFAPIPNDKLGLIILDEEHEYSYKSENSPRYHAREVAKYRSAKAGILLLLGSATPSVESQYLAETGVIRKFELTERYGNASLAQVEIVDRKEDLRMGNDRAIGSTLANYMAEAIHRKEQCILFINRRGRNRRLLCMECGETVNCEHCTSAMSYHSNTKRLVCHICGYTREVPLICPSCHSSHLMMDKAGTQKIEEEIEELLPGATYIRMDADSTASRMGHTKILEEFRENEIDVLVGTQMITKGLDFENVTLVGVLDADMALYAADFRAAERTFSLLTQVVGRAGRGSKKGKAVIQTFSPQNQVLLAAANQDYEAFYREEIALRETLQLPPFTQVLYFQISGLAEEQVMRSARSFAEQIKFCLDVGDELLGPVPSVVYKANNRFRWSLTVKTNHLNQLRDRVEGAMCAFYKEKNNKGVSLIADENPYDVQ